MAGKLFVVATPIGNLGDITFRAVETLKGADVIACEDTRRTEQLLRHLGFAKPLLRYDEHTHERGSRAVIAHLESGRSVALATDAGTPGVSDPGARLVREVAKHGFIVVPIPGPSALLAALSFSGFPTDNFVFLGFLPRRPGRAKRVLREGLGLGKTVAIFESPFRVGQTLEWIEECAPENQVVVARELTKIHEEALRGSAAEVRAKWAKRPTKGEVVIVIEGSDRTC